MFAYMERQNDPPPHASDGLYNPPQIPPTLPHCQNRPSDRQHGAGHDVQPGFRLGLGCPKRGAPEST